MKTGWRILGLNRPLGEFIPAHSLEISHVVRSRTFLLIEGLLVGTEGRHRPIEELKRRLVQAGADM